MAKRIQFAAYGGPEVLEYRDYQPAEPGPREVRVRNRAIGLNFIDTTTVAASIQPPASLRGWVAKGPARSRRWAAK